MEAEDLAVEEKRRKEEAEKEKATKRIALNEQRQSWWDFGSKGLPIEISGDSLVICNWIDGLFRCTTDVYSTTVSAIQDLLDSMSVWRCPCTFAPPHGDVI
eukprot:6054340-Pyramimonas_sp.AAC.1